MGENDIGTAAQVAAALGIRTKRISDFAGAGKLRNHGRTIGGHKLFKLSEVRAFLAARPERTDDPTLRTSDELATLLQRSPNTIAGWVGSGALPVAGSKKNSQGRWVNAYRLADAQALDRQHGRNKGTTTPARTLALPPEPTLTRPGSEERMRVYEARVEAGLQIFHPDDLRLNTRGAA